MDGNIFNIGTKYLSGVCIYVIDLGINLSESGTFTKAIQELSNKARRAT